MVGVERLAIDVAHSCLHDTTSPSFGNVTDMFVMKGYTFTLLFV